MITDARFKIGDKVKIVGPTLFGTDLVCFGKEYTIRDMEVERYYLPGVAWFPRDSLELVQDRGINEEND